MSLTGSQRQAIEARGNVLVVAGAGTGKTRTLVERCLALVLDPADPVGIDELLLVTFTDAAAAEMRKRIRSRLDEEASGKNSRRCLEQLALLDSARIGTIHSFCYSLIRQHFYELEVDPQAAVIPKEEADLLAAETLDKVLTAGYRAGAAVAEPLRNLVRAHGQGSDEKIRRAILKIHHYSQTLHDPAAWLDRQIAEVSRPEPLGWRTAMIEAFPALRQTWLAKLSASGADQYAGSLVSLTGTLSLEKISQCLANAFEATLSFSGTKKSPAGKALESFRGELQFLLALLNPDKGSDPLLEDWKWFREPMLTLLSVTRDFSAAFAKARRELGVLDFHDLEQHTLRLLWDSKTDRPTPIAESWRAKLRYVFVDEYQDTNNAQDKIITALSRDGTEANRFLVGDVKQSIYRFRLASPEIFRNYAQNWAEGTIALSENFRSRQSLLALVNQVFEFLMKPEVGGIEYKGQALEFGAPAERKLLASNADNCPRTEVHLRVKNAETRADEEEGGNGTGSYSDLLDTEKEARMVGLRLIELIREAAPIVYDEQARACRPANWGDVAILLRAPSKKAEGYSKVFAQLGIPLQVAKRGFYDSSEITDLLSLLQVLDNPLQDIPLLAVLHSPFGNLGPNELATVRLASRKSRFFSALTLYGKSAAANDTLSLKVRAFLQRFQRWRRMARLANVSGCLELILSETHYCEWLLVQPRGEQRFANVRRFLALAREFDQFQRRGLMRFLSFIDAQRQSDVEPAVAATETAQVVRLMSVHQSKGLEFPVVVLPDLGKTFNEGDLREKFILSSKYGPCTDIKPPHTRLRYPSLPLWLARRAERRELLGEEMRLLYVAMTRARDLLILTASVTEKRLGDLWSNPPAQGPDMALAARSWADWIGCWFGSQGLLGNGASGQTNLLSWRTWAEEEIAQAPQPQANGQGAGASAGDGSQVIQKLSFAYPFKALTSHPAKSSVSALRRRAQEQDEPAPHVPRWLAAAAQAEGKLSGADRGSAHHSFLERVSLKDPANIQFLREQAKEMLSAGALTRDETAALDLEAIAAFWDSAQGRELLAHKQTLRRELPFTARFTPDEIEAATGIQTGCGGCKDEFVIVQGVADLVVVLEDQIWLYDFKTDRLKLPELTEKVEAYRPQMAIYAAALSKIYKLPVTRASLYFIALRQFASALDTPPRTRNSSDSPAGRLLSKG